jgi:restriction system protein
MTHRKERGVEDALMPLSEIVAEALRILWPVWIALAGFALLRIGLWLRRRQRLARSGIAEVDRMSGGDFERYLAAMFRALGYRVERIGGTGDFGADLIVTRDGIRTIVQAKRYARNVGVKAVQEAVAAKGMYDCAAAMVVTNSRFTRQAQALAKANGVELWERETLIAAMVAARMRKGEDRPVEASVSQESS